MDATALVRRIDQLLSLADKEGHSPEGYSQVIQGATGIMDLVYGPQSSKLATLQDSIRTERPRLETTDWATGHSRLSLTTAGALKNVKQEIEAGLIGSLSQQVTGEVLSDFIKLARAVLEEQGEGHKNVAAVLAAAAFEDTIRRMGAALAGIRGDENLQDVLISLKDQGFLRGPQFSTAPIFSYLPKSCVARRLGQD
jgi:hypothetical protein